LSWHEKLFNCTRSHFNVSFRFLLYSFIPCSLPLSPILFQAKKKAEEDAIAAAAEEAARKRREEKEARKKAKAEARAVRVTCQAYEQLHHIVNNDALIYVIFVVMMLHFRRRLLLQRLLLRRRFSRILGHKSSRYDDT
jgi:hypothetical protein